MSQHSQDFYQFQFDASLSRVLQLVEVDGRKSKIEKITGNTFDIDTNASGAVTQVVRTEVSRQGTTEVSIYSDANGDQRFDKTFEIEVAGASARQLEQHRFTFDNAGNVTAEMGRKGNGAWKTERTDANEHRATTLLLEGAVKAYASGREQASVRLHPAQQLVFDTRAHAMRLTDCPSAERSINWIDGRFCFEHDTFGEIVAELKRYYNVDIRFMDTRLRDMRFSGNFRVEDGIYHIMSVLQLTYKFNYRIAGNDIELYANPER